MSTLNRQTLLSLTDFKSIAGLMKDPATQGQVIALMKGDRELNAHINNLLLARNAELEKAEAEVDHKLVVANPPTTEELAAEAQQMASAAPTVEEQAPTAPAAPVVPDYAAEDAALLTAGVRVIRDEAGKAINFVEEYQVKDDQNRPIGRPTHLEARTLAELLVKKRTAHENATKAFHRLKEQKLKFTEQQNHMLTAEEIKAAATKALESKDVAEAEKVVRGILENEFKKKEDEIQQAKSFQEGQKIGIDFVTRHLYDFNPCRANMVALAEYCQQHGLDFTLDNLEVAFIDLSEQGDKLAPPVHRASEATRPVEQATNTPVTTAAPVASAQSELPAEPAAAATQTVVAQPTVETIASQPAVAATVTTPVAANQPTATRRPGVNGSLPPGTMSANRPSAADPNQARKEFMRELKSMPTDVMKKRLKTDPQFVKQLQTYGIQVR